MILGGLLVAACASSTADMPGGETTCDAGEELIDGTCQAVGRDTGMPDLGQPDTGIDAVDTATDVGDAGPSCADGITGYCRDDNTAVECQEGGIEVVIGCEANEICIDGVCTDTTDCDSGDFLGCHDDHNERICGEDGDVDIVPCSDPTPNCITAEGGCTEMLCEPFDTRCAEGEGENVEICNSDGTAWEATEPCAPGLRCVSGTCLSPCEENAKETSFLGCDYWALDLDNVEKDCNPDGTCDRGECNDVTNKCEPSAASQQFAVTVSNPNPEPVEVTVTNAATVTTDTVTVPASTVQVINLDRLDVNGPGITSNGYHFSTNLPVTMHQFNPAHNLGVFSNDASLLLPSNTGGLDYVLLNWPTGRFNNDLGLALSYAAVVAIGEEGSTTVTVTSTVDIEGNDEVSAITAEEPTEFELQYGQVLSLQTTAVDTADLTGTLISATQDVLVFAGHECAFVQDGDPYTAYCDHVEQQLFPVEAWGERYLVAKVSPRGAEPDVIRVVASQDGTALTTNPMITGVHGHTLEQGDMIEFEVTGGFEIRGTKPILVGQFIVGSNHEGIEPSCFNPFQLSFVSCLFPIFCPTGLTCEFIGGLVCVGACTSQDQCDQGITGTVCGGGYCSVSTGIGDPAFMLSVPLTGYRDNYIFLTPADYREDWTTAIVPSDAVLTLDGTAVPTDGYIPIVDGWSLVHMDMTTEGGFDPARVHTITGTAEFGLQVYGYDCDVSYAYPGGLNLSSDDEE